MERHWASFGRDWVGFKYQSGYSKAIGLVLLRNPRHMSVQWEKNPAS